ncbi:MAG: betaine/proline/choline family ABC transporter ATP-binding protein [Acidimicrobiia bacterium]|nr:betaine/proline/choline family ABC transporter ATP-binding protein [Acidimicrobiia bacterium]
MSKDQVLEETEHVVGLDDVSFSVDKGEIFVVMGLSGSGKSTALRTVNKLIGVTEGSVRVENTEVTTLHGRALQEFRRTKLGMVFQHFALFPHRTVLDNVGYGLKVQGVDRRNRERAALEALEMVGLAPYALAAPHELSGGMQQRVGLARALASDPDILLMDEAFSALDPLIRRQMQDELMTLQEKLHKTILFITHDLNEALRVGNRVCIMKDGAVVQIGTPEEILTRPADEYVAEFVQDVDQGRVILVETIMHPPDPLRLRGRTISEVIAELERSGPRIVVDDADKVAGILTAEDALRVSKIGSQDLLKALRTDVDSTTPAANLASNYAAAGRGLPIPVLEGRKLVGQLDPIEVLAELGRVERLAEDLRAENANGEATPDPTTNGGGGDGGGGASSSHDLAVTP